MFGAVYLDSQCSPMLTMGGEPVTVTVLLFLSHTGPSK